MALTAVVSLWLPRVPFLIPIILLFDGCCSGSLKLVHGHLQMEKSDFQIGRVKIGINARQHCICSYFIYSVSTSNLTILRLALLNSTPIR